MELMDWVLGGCRGRSRQADKGAAVRLNSSGSSAEQ